jgi:hypothetical protein
MLFLYKELGKDKTPSLETLQYVFPMISHDNPMIRRAVQSFITATAAMYLPSKGKPQPNSSNVQNWHPDCKENRAYFERGSVEFGAETLEWFEQFIEKNLLHIVKVLVDNHEKIGRPQGRGMQKHFNRIMAMSQMGKGDVLLKLFRSNSSSHLTQITSSNKDFKRSQARFIRSICFAFFHNKNIINTLLSESMRLSENLKENDHQFGAAEIFAGVCRAHVLQAEPVASDSQETLLNHFVQCMMNVNSDCIPAWEQSFKYVVRKTDPERVAWLTGPILENAFLEVEEANLDYSKRFLKCVLHVVLSETWRGHVFIGKFMDKIHSDELKFFSTPYRDVRSLLGMIYSVSARFIQPRPGVPRNPLLDKLEGISSKYSRARKKTAFRLSSEGC